MSKFLLQENRDKLQRMSNMIRYNNEVHIHPYLPRRISVAEALAIQTLPADFVLPEDISLTDAFKTIGNGVPYIAAHGVAETIYDYIHQNNPAI